VEVMQMFVIASMEVVDRMEREGWEMHWKMHLKVHLIHDVIVVVVNVNETVWAVLGTTYSIVTKSMVNVNVLAFVAIAFVNVLVIVIVLYKIVVD
jgi:hypothetical protein